MVCSRLQLHEADTWCSRHRQYCNPHEHKARGDVESEESVSMRKGIGHGPCKKHYGKNGRDATWSEPPHAQCSTLLAAVDSRKKAGGAQHTIAAAGPDALPARGRVCSTPHSASRTELLACRGDGILDEPNWRPTFLMAVERMPQCGPTDADAVGAQVTSSGGEVDRVRVAVVGATVEPDEVAKQPRVE